MTSADTVLTSLPSGGTAVQVPGEDSGEAVEVTVHTGGDATVALYSPDAFLEVRVPAWALQDLVKHLTTLTF